MNCGLNWIADGKQSMYLFVSLRMKISIFPSDWASLWPAGGWHHSDHFWLQPWPKGWRHPPLCDDRRGSLLCHPQPLRGLLQVRTTFQICLVWIKVKMNYNKVILLISVWLNTLWCILDSAVCFRIVCKTEASGKEKMGHVSVEVSGGEFGLSSQTFSYQVCSTFHFITVGKIKWTHLWILCSCRSEEVNMEQQL